MADDDGQWARDLVLTELRRAGGDAINARDLQERTALGTEDLRAALTALREEHVIELYGEGYRQVVEGQIGAEAQEDVLAAAEPPAAAPPPGPVASAEALPAVADTRFETQILLTVGYYPQLREGEDEDSAAVREAWLLRDRAESAISEEWPDLPVAGHVVAVQAFGAPRNLPVR